MWSLEKISNDLILPSVCYRSNYLFRGQSDRIADMAFALHVADLGSISGISYGPPSRIVVISEGRVKSNP